MIIKVFKNELINKALNYVEKRDDQRQYRFDYAHLYFDDLYQLEKIKLTYSDPIDSWYYIVDKKEISEKLLLTDVGKSF